MQPVAPHIIKKEFDRSIERFLIITAWLGVLLNLLWFISDLIVVPAHAKTFFFFRLAVSLISILALLLREKLHITIYHCLFILVLGISVQNAYMWSVMDIREFQRHAFAYMVLFVGAGMLVLWELKLSLWLAALTIVANIIFYISNSSLPLEEFFINGGLLTLTVVAFCILMIRTRYRLTYSEIKSRLELEQSKVEIQKQKDDLQEKNREITDSINYARDIQSALIPSGKKFRSHFSDSFVLFAPKDIVSGDFYWVQEKKDHIFYVTADCTGHGVPGGFMTMLGLSFLDEIIIGQDILDPSEVLNQLRDRIITTLSRSGREGDKKDGMDIIVCCIDKQKKELRFAANISVYMVSQNCYNGHEQMLEIKGDRQPCGYSQLNNPFVTRKISLKSGDCIYTFTDGYPDQFGGPKGKKFRYKQLEDLLTKNSLLPFAQQRDVLQTTLEKWKGSLLQVDDVLVIGVKVG